jgi:hypothetical protein
MLNIFNHKGNANQNYTKIPSPPVKLAIIKKTKNNKCRVRGQREGEWGSGEKWSKQCMHI